MAPRPRITREAILDAAKRIIGDTGTASITYQTLGDTLGVSKQAIIYWFPSKADLTRELVLPALRDEADSVIAALAGITSGRQAIALFVRALIDYHRADLGRFRLLYAVTQFDTEAWEPAERSRLIDAVHVTTRQMYAALETVLAEAPDVASPQSARLTAVVVHMAAIGLLTMLSMTAALHDPMVHAADSMIDALVDTLTAQHLKPEAAPSPT